MTKMKQTISYIPGVQAIQRKIQLRRNTYNPKYVNGFLQTIPGHTYLGGSVRTKSLMGVGQVQTPTLFMRLASNQVLKFTSAQRDSQTKFTACVHWVNSAMKDISTLADNKAKIKACLEDKTLRISGISPIGFTFRGFYWAYCWNYMGDHEGSVPATYALPDPA